MLMIAAGYEDGNDAATLRRDPMFKLALAAISRPDRKGDRRLPPTRARRSPRPR
jgi:hypothetical protein